MAALSLHHAIFANEKASDLPFRSASSFLHSSPESDESPSSHLFSSAAYQDLIQRQPTHPDGPTSGWDLGLNLLGDPMTAAEHKSLGDHQTKMKLRRLHAINIVFEVLFGIWGTYTTVRYFIAFVTRSRDTEHICALVLGIVSALVVALVITSLLTPLFPRQSHPHAWRHTRSLLRACYLLLLSASAVTNLVLVLMWHPGQRCGWDIDISWYTSADAVTSPCDPASPSAWIAAAVARLVVTCAIMLLFVYTLRCYHKIRHPASVWSIARYSPHLASYSEDMSPTPTSPLEIFKSTVWITRSDSDRTLSQSNVTLPRSNSASTLAPSTSCTGHSRSPPKDMPPLKISPPTSRRPSTHVTSYPSRSETPSHTHPVSSVPHLLRRTSRLSVTKVTCDTIPPNSSPHLERDVQSTRDASEIRSGPSWRPGHRGTGPGIVADVRKAGLAIDTTTTTTTVRHASHPSAVSTSPSTSSHTAGSASEKNTMGEAIVYAYGYGACGPTYPYLDMYNPMTRPGGQVETASESSGADVDEHGVLQGHRGGRAPGPGFPDASSLHTPDADGNEGEDEDEDGPDSAGSGDGEEYVAMMGGFVRRMTTIASLGSREATGTLSRAMTASLSPAGSMRSKTPLSQLSSVLFAEYSSSCGTSSSSPPLVSPVNSSSQSTAYLSFSSGGTGMRANERGELMPGPEGHRGGAGSPPYYTASGSSYPDDPVHTSPPTFPDGRIW